MKAECERCSSPLPPDSNEAVVGSHACTFCRDCTEGELGGHCPNCYGKRHLRPVTTRVAR